MVKKIFKFIGRYFAAIAIAFAVQIPFNFILVQMFADALMDNLETTPSIERATYIFTYVVFLFALFWLSSFNKSRNAFIDSLGIDNLYHRDKDIKTHFISDGGIRLLIYAVIGLIGCLSYSSLADAMQSILYIPFMPQYLLSELLGNAVVAYIINLIVFAALDLAVSLWLHTKWAKKFNRLNFQRN